MMAPADVSPKITLFQEPMIYLRPIVPYNNPIPQVNKSYSGDNYFNHDAYREYRGSKNFKETGETKKDFAGKGLILNILA